MTTGRINQITRVQTVERQRRNARKRREATPGTVEALEIVRAVFFLRPHTLNGSTAVKQPTNSHLRQKLTSFENEKSSRTDSEAHRGTISLLSQMWTLARTFRWQVPGIAVRARSARSRFPMAGTKILNRGWRGSSRFAPKCYYR